MRCNCLNSKGEWCKKEAIPNSLFCKYHQGCINLAKKIETMAKSPRRSPKSPRRMNSPKKAKTGIKAYLDEKAGCKTIRTYALNNLTEDEKKNISIIASKCLKEADISENVEKILGCGEQGCTYSLSEQSTVLKITPILTEKDKKSWLNEASIGCELGNIHAAPQIFNSFLCSGYGFIQMEKLMDASKLPNGVVIREYDPTCNREEKGWKNDCYKEDFLTRMPISYQVGFIDALTNAIRKGFVHMDNHIENIGFLLKDNKPCLFDFGFTQRRIVDEEDFDYALSFSVAQILEHCPLSEFNENNKFYEYFTSVVDTSGPYVKYSKRVLDSFIEEGKLTKNPDLYVGCRCYAEILKLEATKRFNKYKDVIYDIRRGTFKI